MSSCTRGRKIPNVSPDSTFNPAYLYQVLYDHYGPSFWWPGETPFEVMVGAVLTQNTAWTNVEKAIINLKAAALMDVAAIDNTDAPYLASLLRPSGYYNIKTSRLKNLIHMIMTSHSGNLDDLFSLELPALRTELLGVNGIGKETADSICCYAADKCIFVVDAYTKRILMRHGIIEQHAGYEEIQSLFEAGLPRELAVYKDIHAHIVYIGKDYCKARNPRCDACPLKGQLQDERTRFAPTSFLVEKKRRLT